MLKKGDIVIFKNKRPMAGELQNQIINFNSNYIYSVERNYPGMHGMVSVFGIGDICREEHFTKVEDEIRGITLFKEGETVVCADNTPADNEINNNGITELVKSLVIGKKYVTERFLFCSNIPWIRICNTDNINNYFLNSKHFKKC